MEYEETHVEVINDDDIGSDEGAWTAGERELEELEAFAAELIAMGVGMVACQRLIHPCLRRRLALAGVLCLERLSALNISAFRSVRHIILFLLAVRAFVTVVMKTLV